MIGPRIGIYNIYGRIVFRKSKGCAYYYKLPNAHKRYDGWITASNSLEKEAIDYATTDMLCVLW